MLLPDVELSSSNVTISRPLCVFAHWAYASRWVRSQVSPVATEQSCMSLHRLGVMNATVGRLVKVLGKLAYVRLLAAGTLEKSTQLLCLRAYVPLVQPV